MKRNTIFLLIMCFACTAGAQLKHSATSAFKSYKGLVMAGYQGWFNAMGDGGGRGWNHYAGAKGFAPGSIKIDLWPDVSEYKKTYKTAFQHADGSAAYLFSSYDESTVQLHFKWMEQYGIDGVFVQRFVSNLKNAKSLAHNNKVLRSALDAAGKHKRAISLMYDFSGMQEGDEDLVINDFKNLVDSLRLTNRGNKQSYLYHNQKPLVALWGIGFNDKRRYTLKTITKIMDFLQHDPVYGGCSLLLGVPTQWRELKGDATSDPELLEVCKKADIIQPWFVGRFREDNISVMMERIKADIAWCKANRLDFVPVIYPGFSWHNMKPNSPFDQIPRNRGQFFWKQLSGAINNGVEMIYVAMFDEVDEGTAIFKASKNPPVGENSFVKFEEGIPNDYYLYLAGFASKMLKKQIPFQQNIPLPK
ncbi:glycoside hydrolase family 71/99-like protein [Pedobacter miscanthi]|jgi:glycoprotein endo-alpha-1,2-mannosidase|uniref:glycoside hydrolase family 71/99-like protein n=1 Tax=Pedobacter miscanthi TaxID=2259170 RepID=UPI00292FD119|nr:glycoside hydrolase family 71/99-like protein [Pedobacter miscanthi]